MKNSTTVAVLAFLGGAACATVIHAQVATRFSTAQFIKSGASLINQISDRGKRVLRVDGYKVIVFAGKEDGECVDPPDPTIFLRGAQSLNAQQAATAAGQKFEVIAATNCHPE